ncbi:hypothetical protein MMC31_006132, partial [Peltigera leucophlebia]|nr:hypothetical protein [Peltigera leucophlebia]
GARPIETAAPFGLKILAEGIDPVLDIVAIHGINGGREETWTVKGQNWLRDFLPQKITNARIYSWGYDAITHSPSQISHQHIYEHANTLLSNLYDERRISKTLERPIIFVAYSLGGIVLQMAMLKAPNYKEHQPIRLSTYGIIFMGTPHLGSDGADIGQLALNVASIFMSTNTKVVKSLKKDSVLLKQLLDDYGKISGEFDTTFAYETVETKIFGKRQMIVPRASAVVPGARTIAIGADHIHMVKFASREDEGYRAVSDRLYFMAEAVEKKIRAVPEDIKKAQANMKDNFSVPFSLSGVPEAPQFVGRKKELIKIKEEFNCNGSQRKVVVLHGLGGIGKTQLAVASVKEHRDICSAIFWLNGKNEDSLKQSFVDMAKRLYNESQPSPLLTRALENNDTNQVVAALKNWFSSSGNTRWILVFDNVDNPKYPGISDPEAYDVSSYFPEAYQGSILITTRSSHLSIGKVVHVPVTKLVDIKESIIILASMSERQISDQALDPCAIELVKELDGLPLALATAGAYLRQLSISLADYLSLYQERWKELLKKSPDFPSYRHRALNTTWDLSFQHIQRQNKSAEKLLQLWAYFDNQDLWFELLAAGREESPEWFAEIVKDKLSFNEVIRLLCDHALIEPVHSVGGYSMHTCVRAWVVHMLDTDQKSSMARLALNCVGSAVPTIDISEHIPIGRRLLPHALRCSKLIGTAIDIQGPENQKTYRAIQNLGFLYSGQDKLNEAKALYKRALDGFEKLLGREHSSTLNVVYKLGNLYAHQNKLQEAEEMYLRVQAGQKEGEGAENDFSRDIVNNLATLYLVQDKIQKAETMYKQVLKDKEKALGQEHTSTLDTIYNLGHLYQRQGKIQEAAAMYTRALNGYKKAWGPKNTSTLDSINSLGTLYLDQGETNEAEKMFRQAWKVSKEMRGPEHTSTLTIVNNLAIISSRQGKIEEAEAMYRQVLKGYEEVFGPEHTSTLGVVSSLATLYNNQGELQKAEAMYQRALKGKEKALGPEHTSTLYTVNNFAGLFKNQGKIQEAEAMYRRALEGNKKTWGPEHQLTLRTLNNLGVVYSNQGKFQEAESMYTQALQGCENTLGSEHTITLETVNNLGAISLKQGKIQEAETMYLRALKGKEKVWGTEHMSTIDTVSNLGILYAIQDRMQDAEVMHLRALKGKMKALGPEHISTLRTIKCLTNLYKNQGKMESAEAMIRRALQSN